MDKEKEIIEALRSLNGKIVPSFIAIVKEVNGSFCNVLVDDYVVPNVQLKAHKEGNCLIEPEINSYVLISPVEDSDTQFYVSQYSKIKTISLFDGKEGGIVCTEPLVKKLNNIEKTLNKLISEFTNHAHFGGSGSAVGNVFPIPTTQSINNITDKKEIEHKKIKI